MEQSKCAESLQMAMREKLLRVHQGLLNLHKLLIDSERTAYEAEHGSISRGELLQLLIGNEFFAWLKTFSKLIIKIDDATDAKTKDTFTPRNATELLMEAKRILEPVDGESDFENRFSAAVQREPSVAFAQKELLHILERELEAEHLE